METVAKQGRGAWEILVEKASFAAVIEQRGGASGEIVFSTFEWEEASTIPASRVLDPRCLLPSPRQRSSSRGSGAFRERSFRERIGGAGVPA